MNSTNQSVQYTIKNNIVSILLNRPEKRNAFDAEMIQLLTQAFNEAADESEARVLLLQGEGKSFSAGADLSWMKSSMEFSFEENQEDAKKLREMYLSLKRVPYPVVAHAQGHVMGGALGLVALADVAAAETSTKFCFSEVKLGLAPAVVSEFVYNKINNSDLQRYLLTAEVFDGTEAQKMGLIHFHSTMTEVESFVAKLVEKIANNGPVATRSTKSLLQKLHADSSNIKDHSVPLIAQLRTGTEGQEGLISFFEKRKPSWGDQP